MQDVSATFSAQIQDFLEKSGFTPTSLGKEAVGDPNFISDFLNNRRSPTLHTVKRVQEFIKKHSTPSVSIPSTVTQAKRKAHKKEWLTKKNVVDDSRGAGNV